MCAKDAHQLKLLGLQNVFSGFTESHDILDTLLKVLLEEKYVVRTTKLNICTFIEEQTSLLNSVTDAELIFATLKNLYDSTSADDGAVLQGKCLTTMTTVMVQAATLFQGEEVIELFTEILNVLLALVKQVNNVKNFYARSVAANCLLEIELCFPTLLKPYVDMLYTATVTETTTAHQQYLCLLSLTVKNFLSNESSSRQHILAPFIQEQLPSKMAWPETAVPEVSFSNINQVMSFIVDQVPLLTSEAIVWITEQLVPLLKAVPSCLPLLQPLLLTVTRSHYLPLVHIVHLLQLNFGEALTSTLDQSHILSLLSLNTSAACLPVAQRLIALDILADRLAAIPSAVHPVGQAAAVTVLLPAAFDGPETQLKKIAALISVLHSRPGATAVLIPVLESIRKEVLYINTNKSKSVLVKAVFKCWNELQLTDLSSRIPNLVASVVEDDLSFVPFALSLEEKMRYQQPASDIPRELLSLLVQVTTQPPTVYAQIEDTALNNIIAVFWAALYQPEQGTEWVKPILMYLVKHILNQETCSAISWSSGHKILSLCYYLMREYEPMEIYFELCEVLNSIITWTDDIDLQDRAQIYYAIIASHSTKKLNVPKCISVNTAEDQESFRPTSVVMKLEKPVLKLSKCGTKRSPNAFSMDVNNKSEKEIVEEYYRCIQTMTTQSHLILNCSLSFTQECSRSIMALDGLAIKFFVPSSWGHIETAMIGHVNKKNFRETKDIYKIEILCYPSKPFPVTAQVRAEFSVAEVCHICSLDPFKVEFVDFFECMPLQETSEDNSIIERVYSSLWNDLQGHCCESVTILHSSSETVLKQLEETLEPFKVYRKSGDNLHYIGILLPPQYHLLAQFCIGEEETAITFVTEDAYILSLAGIFFSQLV